jgi:hypothetical protein
MSYCRWSSDSFRCDVYAYEHVGGGFTIHVAGSRYVLADHLRDPLETLNTVRGDAKAFEKLAADHRAFLDDLGRAARDAIASPSAGESFHEPTLQAFKARMLALRAEGLCFPDDVLTRIDEEIELAEENAP